MKKLKERRGDERGGGEEGRRGEGEEGRRRRGEENQHLQTMYTATVNFKSNNLLILFKILCAYFTHAIHKTVIHDL